MMKMEPSDSALVSRALEGDADAFGTLIARHYERIFRIGWRILGSRAEAEDLAQDVCAALPARLAGFEARARFTTWLHSVAVNAARDRLRRQATHARAAAGWGEAELLRRAEAREAAEDQEWLTAAMRALSPDLRETVALVLGEEMTHAEAGTALGVSEGTVSWRMSEVRKTLRALAETEEQA